MNGENVMFFFPEQLNETNINATVSVSFIL